MEKTNKFRKYANKASKNKRSFMWIFNRKNSKTYNEMVNCLERLNEVGKSDADNMQKVDEMIKLHEDLGKITEKYLRQKKSLPLTTSGRERKRLAEHILNLQKEENISIFRDTRALSDAKKNGKFLADLLNETRIPVVNVREIEKKTEGGALSTRQKITYNKQEGYFTDGEDHLLKTEEAKAKALSEISKKTRAFIESRPDIFENPNNGGDKDNIYTYIAKEKEAKEKEEELRKLHESKEPVSEEKLKRINQEKESAQRLVTNIQEALPGSVLNMLKNDTNFKSEMYFYISACSKSDDIKDVAEVAGIEFGSELTRRNVATSRMASLLGIDSLIAKSERMILEDGEKKRNGVFMAKAVGLDINNMDIRETVFGKGVDLSTIEAQKQITSLQIFDTLCGQVDRHCANMLYDVKNGKVVGIQGIDNDMAFGKATNIKNEKRQLPSIETLKVADAALVNKLNSLTRQEIDRVLSDVLTEPEREALWTRKEALCTYLKGNDVTKKNNDSEWNKQSFEGLKNQKGGYVQRIFVAMDAFIDKTKVAQVQQVAQPTVQNLRKQVGIDNLQVASKPQVASQKIAKPLPPLPQRKPFSMNPPVVKSSIAKAPNKPLPTPPSKTNN